MELKEIVDNEKACFATDNRRNFRVKIVTQNSLWSDR